MDGALKPVLLFLRELKPKYLTGVNDGVMHVQIIDGCLDFITQGVIGGSHVGELSVGAYRRNDFAQEQRVTTRWVHERRIGMPEAVAEVVHAAAVVPCKDLALFV